MDVLWLKKPCAAAALSFLYPCILYNFLIQQVLECHVRLN